MIKWSTPATLRPCIQGDSDSFTSCCYTHVWTYYTFCQPKHVGTQSYLEFLNDQEKKIIRKYTKTNLYNPKIYFLLLFKGEVTKNVSQVVVNQEVNMNHGRRLPKLHPLYCKYSLCSNLAFIDGQGSCFANYSWTSNNFLFSTRDWIIKKVELILRNYVF